MDVGVHYGLTGNSPIIHADVKPSRLELLQQLRPNLRHQPPQGRLLFDGQIEKADNVFLGDGQGVALGHGKSVGQREADLVFEDNSGGVQVAEWAGWRHFATIATETRLANLPGR